MKRFQKEGKFFGGFNFEFGEVKLVVFHYDFKIHECIYLFSGTIVGVGDDSWPDSEWRSSKVTITIFIQCSINQQVVHFYVIWSPHKQKVPTLLRVIWMIEVLQLDYK